MFRNAVMLLVVMAVSAAATSTGSGLDRYRSGTHDPQRPACKVIGRAPFDSWVKRVRAATCGAWKN